MLEQWWGSKMTGAGSITVDTSNHELVSQLIDPKEDADAAIRQALAAVRKHLGMEVAYVSEIVGDQSIFREVDAPGLEALIKPGDSRSLDDVYCLHILEGRLPELIPDTAEDELAKSLPITAAVPIGAHISVPVRLPDGELYGMFCCLGFEANPTLNQRDLQMMRAFAELTAHQIHRKLASERQISEKIHRIKTAIEEDNFAIAYQPIWNIANNRPAGVECLTRFSNTSYAPNEWFQQAAEVGLGTELELSAIGKALLPLRQFPDHAYMAVNLSAATILSEQFQQVFKLLPVDRIVVEITEYASVSNYAAISQAIEPLRQRGLQLAVDDAGSGYAGLQHVVDLRPEIIKLDMNLIRNIHRDPAREALVGALVAFARKTRSQIVAEGVEVAEELATLKKVGVELAQGYHLARPLPLRTALAVFQQEAIPSLRVA